jgi:tRNA(fMet)-specific endonuclease VapC
MIVLDTDTLTLAHTGHVKVSERFRKIDPSSVAITIVTRIEILQGRFASILKAKDGAQLIRAQEMLQSTNGC